MPTRLSAPERRAALVSAAHRHFARGGLHGTAVSAITADVGITQPYAFSLFGTKRELFLAACEHNADRVIATFRAAAEGAAPEERLAAMGRAYIELLADREVLLMQLQSQAAAAEDAEVRKRVKAGYARVREAVAELSGAGEHELMTFIATGMYLNLVASVDAPEWMPEDLAAPC
jgi:AcrR family transcriptional regulator